jgi:hypothetical protein
MLIAMFTAESGMAGRLITYHHGRFILESEGEVTPARIMTLDQLDLLEWAHPALRSWTASLVPDDSIPSRLTARDVWPPFREAG